MGTMFPWFSQLVGDDVALLGEDWWQYGIGANRKAIDAALSEILGTKRVTIAAAAGGLSGTD